MRPGHLGPEARKSLEVIVGYLNFSSGAEDPRFLASLNALFAEAAERRSGPGEDDQAQPGPVPSWRAVGQLIRAGVEQLRGSSDAFRRLDQAEAVVRLVFDEVLPAYRRHHRDLLFHQTEEFLFQPLFIGRACEAVLAEGGPWNESDRIVPESLRRLNDYLGHRPVAVLETEQKLQPYAHEWVRPIPLFIAGAGVAVGPYHDVVGKALEIFDSTDRGLLDRAWFDPRDLHELALDPRAYDFDHPVNRRPNHYFGGWDPHLIDNRGRYRRFVLRQVTLDALLGRVEERDDLPHDEVLFEAAAVLAGTMLMGSGISGNGPDAHDSSTTLATLLPAIASYRDAFYKRLVRQIPAAHAERLRAEATALRQPFGGARQHLNQALARRRAEQLQHVHLGRLFARMGYTEAAARQTHSVPVASARMQNEIDCRLSEAHLRIDRGQLDAAAALVPEMEDLLHRAIECGAMVDPWNILGFGGQYPLFPAVENSVHDHRIDELVDLMSDLFTLCARLQKEAAAAGRGDLESRLADGLAALARWWDQFASTEVSGVEGVSGRQAWESAGQVAAAIRAWHEAGTAAGDLGFWKQHVEQFGSPESFALLIETLIDRGDLVASMALLMLWLSRAEEIPLAEADHSFYALAARWMERLWRLDKPASEDASDDPWPLSIKFFDYLEANAGEHWDVPRLELPSESGENGPGDEPDDASHGLFGAAYENVTYRDTTDDGFEGEMLEGGAPATDFELAAEFDRIVNRLALLVTVARLWKLAAAASATRARASQPESQPQREAEDEVPRESEGDRRDDVLAAWLAQAVENRRRLLDLLQAVHRYRIRATSGSLDAMIEYDRRRAIKDTLLERIIVACVESADAARFLLATMDRDEPAGELGDWDATARRVLRAMFRGDVQSVRAAWPALLDALGREPLLYIPTSRGGNPRRIVVSRSLQRMLARLLTYAPRLGLLRETYRLLVTIQAMEQNGPVGPGAITEFDRLFEIGCRAICECLVVSSEDWRAPSQGRERLSRRLDLPLVDCLERAVEPLLALWMSHSRNIRLSVLEAVAGNGRWQELKRFIRSYGRDLFTQPFLNYGNLRAILHQGAGAYLRVLEESPDEEPLKLVSDLDHGIPRDEAARLLELAVEAVAESYSEYADYNSTTTQSDHGEKLYVLLDFLRLLASYDRVAWNLKPIVIGHDVMVRHGRNQAARTWERALAARTADVADSHLNRLDRLTKRHGLRLSSIAERLGERFVQPLAVDRLCALVRPAVEELQEGRRLKSFKRLEKEVARFTQQPSGVGYEVPGWLEALEDEIARLRFLAPGEREPQDPATAVPQVRLSREQAEREIASWDEEGSP